MSTAKNKNVLGRGLGNLLGGETSPEALQSTASIQELPLEKIAPNPDQPRKHFEQEALDELAASLKTLGLVQPITVQALPSGTFQIISGERRWRAAQMAGLKTLPAYIRATQPSELLELALIENIQREDLNAIEVALAYQQLTEQYGLSQSKVAERVGKKRVTITNYIRLLQLPAEIQLGLTQRLIDMDTHVPSSKSRTPSDRSSCTTSSSLSISASVLWRNWLAPSLKLPTLPLSPRHSTSIQRRPNVRTSSSSSSTWLRSSPRRSLSAALLRARGSSPYPSLVTKN